MRLAWILPLLVACSEHGSGGGSGNDGGSGAECGGFVAAQCPADEWCDFGRNSCGIADESGVCRKRPSGCPRLFQPTCGCDNVIHGSACDANAAGVDVNANGTCPVEAGKFACGFLQCTTVSEYCERATSDIGGEPDGFTCKLIPGCPANLPNCACLANEPCGTNCTGDGAVGLTVTCLGG